MAKKGEAGSAPAARPASSKDGKNTGKGSEQAAGQAGPRKRAPRGHRQKGAGTVVTSRGEITRNGVQMKEWQRSPQQLVLEYCQREKRPKPQFRRTRAVKAGMHRCKLVLPDPKKDDKTMVFTTNESYPDEVQARNLVALLGLQYIDPLQPLERKLPDPYREIWLRIVGRDKPTATTAKGKKAKKRAAKAAEEGGDGAAGAAEAAREAVGMPDVNVAVSLAAPRGAQGHGSAPAAAAAPNASVPAPAPGGTTTATPVAVTARGKFASEADRRRAREERERDRRQRVSAREAREKANPDARVYMSEAARRMAERVIGSAAPPAHADGEEGAPPGTPSALLVDEIVTLGFDAEDARKVAGRASTVADALDWLCLNLPEGRLPPGFDPRGRQMEVEWSGRDSAASATAGRLAAFGFPDPYCRAALDACGGDEARARAWLVERAAAALCASVAAASVASPSPPLPVLDTPDDWRRALIACAERGAEAAAVVGEDIEALEAILGGDCTLRRGGPAGGVEFATAVLRGAGPGGSSVTMHVWPTTALPAPMTGTAPLPTVLCACPALQRHQLLSLQAQLAHAVAARAGEHTLFDLSTALQMDLDAMLAAPAPMLPPLAAGGSARGEVPPATAARQPAPSRRAGGRAGGGGGSEARRRGRPPTYPPLGADRAMEQREGERLRQAEAGAAARRGSMLAYRRKLPAWAHRGPVVDAVRGSQVVLVQGETGCGKTTQFLLADAIARGEGGATRIVCTQPRRLAAVGVADRVAAERCEPVGGSVGYSIRGERRCGPDTRLEFCTVGILLRRLQDPRTLRGVSHLLVDEVHERGVETDFLLVVLRRQLRAHPRLRLVLMSATMDAARFAAYFSPAAAGGTCPVLSIPGFVHPVRELYLEDVAAATGYRPPRRMMVRPGKAPEARFTVAAHARRARGGDGGGGGGDGDDDDDGSGCGGNGGDGGGDHGSDGGSGNNSDEGAAGAVDALPFDLSLYDDSQLDYELLRRCVVYALTDRAFAGDDGAVLVFMPGTAEIRRLCSMLEEWAAGPGACKCRVLPLHGALTGDAQRRVFQRPPQGVRKVVVATNVAETSITIDDIAFVVDAGRVKETRFDAVNRMPTLVTTWVSVASARQRRGRAGRVREGHCIRAFSRARFRGLAPEQAPEMQRVPLEQLCLQIKVLGESDVRAFLGEALEPPSRGAVDAALSLLEEVGAIDGKKGGVLTPLGRHLAHIPADVRLAKALILGAVFRCVDPMLTLAAAMSGRSPFRAPAAERRAADAAKTRLARGATSDHLALVRAYEEWRDQPRGGRRGFCRDNFLSFEGMEGIHDLRGQFARALAELGFLPPGSARGREGKAGGGAGSPWAARPGGEALNRNAGDRRVVLACVCGGLYPNVLKVKYPPRRYFEMVGGAVPEEFSGRELRYFQRPPAPGQRGDRAFIHPSSVNFSAGSYEAPWLVYHEVVRTSKVFVRDASCVPPWALLLFGGDIRVDHREARVVVDDWIRFDTPARVGVLAKELRRCVDVLLDKKAESPDHPVADDPVVDVITAILAADGMARAPAS